MGERRNAILAVLAVVVLVALCGGTSWFLVTQELADDARDFLIILLAVESLVIGAFLLLTLWHLYQLIRLLREEVIPLMNTTKETVEQVKHTTTFVGQTVAAPLISVSGLVAGAKQAVNTLRGKDETPVLWKGERDG